MTALIRDLKLTYRDQIELAVDTNRPEVWEANPFLTKLDRSKDPTVTQVEVENKRVPHIHMLYSFHRDFTAKTGVAVDLLYPRPSLFLTPDQLVRPLEQPYWIVVGGGKPDITVKHWVFSRYPEVVARYPHKDVRFVQVGAERDKHREHIHLPIPGALDMRGKTTLRELFRWIYWADGVLCPITLAMHAAAAFEKPCVVTGGGREEYEWIAYADDNPALRLATGEPVQAPHQFLHTLGRLDCCATKGCWTFKLAEPCPPDRLCHWPVPVGDQVVAKCQDAITVDTVLAAMARVRGEEPAPELVENLVEVSHSVPGMAVKIPHAKPRLTSGAAAAPVAKAIALPRPAPKSIAKTSASAALQPKPPSDDVYDHPTIGGRFTIFVYATGSILNLAKRCVESIRQLTPGRRYELRILAGNAGPQIVSYLAATSCLTANASGRAGSKYVMMREALRAPGVDNYAIWFDIGAYTVSSRWLYSLAELIVGEHDLGARAFGSPQQAQFRLNEIGKQDPREWFRNAAWWRGRDFRNLQGDSAPNGDRLHYCGGSFFALHTPTALMADIPDARINHVGGERVLGEQLHQVGATLRAYDRNRASVFVPRREEVSFPGRFPWEG